MKILTTAKKVVDVELTIRVQDGAIVEDGLQYVINAWDENAVEAAVQLKENHGAETTLVSVFPFPLGLKISSQISRLCAPEMRITEMALVPGGVARAQMVSCWSVFWGLLVIVLVIDPNKFRKYFSLEKI